MSDAAHQTGLEDRCRRLHLLALCSSPWIRPASSPAYNFTFQIKGLAMPIYAYRCESCGYAKDVLQKISDAVLSACPACGAGEFKKQLTAAGFQLKGSGWYVTDFKGGTANGNGA